MENIRSFIGEWNGGVRRQQGQHPDRRLHEAGREPRRRYPTLFPFVDILEGGSVYTSFGYEPFTPNNELRYNTFQLQDNFSIFQQGHSLTFGGELRELPVRERVLPRQAERLRLQLAGRLLHRRERLPRQPEPDDVAGHAADASRSAGTTSPGSEKPLQPLEVSTSAPTPRTSWQAKSNFSLTYGLRFDVPVFGDTGYAERRRRRHDVHGRERRHGAVLDGEAAGSEAPVVAARGLQLGRVRQPEHAGPRRHGHLHGQARLRLDLQPDRQHRRADRVRVSSDNTTARPFNPNTEQVQADQRDGRARLELRAGAHRPRTSSSRRSGAPASASTSASRAAGSGPSSTSTARTSTASTTSTPTSRTRTRTLRRRRRHGPRWIGTATASTPPVANAVVLKNQNVGSTWNISGSARAAPIAAGLYVKGGVPLRRGLEHGGPGLDRVRLLEQQPALGQPEQPGRRHTRLRRPGTACSRPGRTRSSG
ncbi:MAG: hypothetical protein MZV64_72755 [Ignavibacteriales bacterium]|nr:hypothetical protein [Ignavibacteriales bacterium]